MSLLKKITGALNSDKNKSQKNRDLLNIPKLPSLQQFVKDNKSLLNANNNDANWRQRSKLSKTTKEVLHDPPALAYFIQYLEARDAVQLVKFWLDVESFKSSATTVISSKFVSSRLPGVQLDKIDENLADNDANPDSFDDEEEFNVTRDEATDTRSQCTVEHPEQAVSRAEHLVKMRTEDAVKIYRRYIAPDCSRPVHLPTELKKHIVEMICADTGQVSANCFDHAQVKVLEILETEYFPDFLKSEYHAKHLVDILTGGQVVIADILFNDTAVAHFMEFMESQSNRIMMEFVMMVINFHQSLSVRSDSCQSDAMVIYEKYFSMQAATPLGFPDSIRLHVENNICSENGAHQTCFDL